jgi:hypothetical protein
MTRRAGERRLVTKLVTRVTKLVTGKLLTIRITMLAVGLVTRVTKILDMLQNCL